MVHIFIITIEVISEKQNQEVRVNQERVRKFVYTLPCNLCTFNTRLLITVPSSSHPSDSDTRILRFFRSFAEDFIFSIEARGALGKTVYLYY